MGGGSGGALALQAALASALVALALSVHGGRRGGARLVRYGLGALFLAGGLLTVALLILATGLLSGDWSLAYVVDYASRATPWPYRLAGLWAGMAGSLLVWTWVLALWSAGAGVWCRRRANHLSAVVQSVLAALVALLSGLLVWVTNPFSRLAIPAIDGAGLTPVLRHPAMLYHPLLLYAGQVGLVVPFALAVGGRVAEAGSVTAAGTWLVSARRWMAVSLVLLGTAMVAGAHWAYVELGWGGYWAWDPVENAALLPWLAGLAFLHVARRGDGPAASRLAALTFGVALGGAFLARSGATSSVHAFAEAAAVGRVLAVALVATAVAWIVLDRKRGGSAIGRSGDGMLLLAAAVLAALITVIAIGTVLPPVWRAVTGDRLIVTGRYFASVTWPFALGLLALSAIGPRTRRRDPCSWVPALAGIPGAIVAWSWLDRPSPLAVAAAAVGSASAALIVAELAGRKAGWRQAGGLLAHLGAVVLLVGVTATTTGSHRDGVVGPDRDLTVRGYTLRLEGIDEIGGAGPGAAVEATIAVRHERGRVATLRPRAVVAPDGQRASVAGLRSTPLEDLAVTLRAVGPDGREAVLAVSVTPLATWVWWGALLVVAGIGLAGLSPPRARTRRASAAAADRSSVVVPPAPAGGLDAPAPDRQPAPARVPVPAEVRPEVTEAARRFPVATGADGDSRSPSPVVLPTERRWRPRRAGRGG